MFGAWGPMILESDRPAADGLRAGRTAPMLRSWTGRDDRSARIAQGRLQGPGVPKSRFGVDAASGRRKLASRPDSFVHTRSSAAFTITTSEFEFSVHTGHVLSPFNQQGGTEWFGLMRAHAQHCRYSAASLIVPTIHSFRLLPAAAAAMTAAA